MSEAERKKWDARYAEGDHPSMGVRPFLLDQSEAIPPDSEVLDLACGLGGAAIFLATMGHRVTGVDVSKVGLLHAERKAREAGLADRVTFIQADLDDWDPGVDRWDAVHCAHYLDRAVFQRVKRSVRPNGLVIFEMLTDKNVALGHFRSATFLAKPRETLGWFADWDVLYFREQVMDGIAEAHLLARRPSLPKD